MDNYIQIRIAQLNQFEQQRGRLSGARRDQIDYQINALREQIQQAQRRNSEIQDIDNNEPASIDTELQHETIIIDDDDDEPVPVVLQQPIDNEPTYWVNPTELAIPRHFRVIQFKPSPEVKNNDLDAALRSLARDISTKIVEIAEQLNCLKICPSLQVR